MGPRQHLRVDLSLCSLLPLARVDVLAVRLDEAGRQRVLLRRRLVDHVSVEVLQVVPANKTHSVTRCPAVHGTLKWNDAGL